MTFDVRWSQERARVNMYMHFHHRTVREATILLIAPLYAGFKSGKDCFAEVTGMRELRRGEQMERADTVKITPNPAGV